MDADRPDDVWRERLTAEQYRVLREKGTERAFVGAYVHTDATGVYRCAACGAPLFDSRAKFDSGSGWPSFVASIDPAAVHLRDDRSHGMVRIEVACAACDGHLGHLFDDGPRDATGLRYCINSVALHLDPAPDADAAPPSGEDG